MDRKFEQRICINFCYKIGKSASETLDLLKLAFGNENVNKPTTFRWFLRFKNGMESVKDLKRVGRPILQRNPEKDNARPHTVQQTLAHISRYVWTLMPHPAYSPDLASSDFYLFDSLFIKKAKRSEYVGASNIQTLTLGEKIAAIKEVEMGMKKKSDIAKDFGIPRNTLSTYLKNKEKILRSESEYDKGRKRLREPGNPDLDKCVLK
ncbi:hypothetical protein LAZ67_17001360 [Cordylochernes scorpioides]|uniref:HTH psq-type domain-containing protein n=1 Tax=Cordylochernes scorpioides TaxID=51811 RepID=A0ABY6LHJ4_9ARAC|nr:hypothetical protein LAZ67_17001360 [Cordylochernes scorpioides]